MYPALEITAFFHEQEELEAEFAEAGFKVEKSLGVAGLSWIIPGLEQSLTDPAKKERLLEVAIMMEKYPMQSTKILTVGVK